MSSEAASSSKDYYGLGDPPPLLYDLPSFSGIQTTCKEPNLPVDILLLTVEDDEFLACYQQLKNPCRWWFDGLGYVYFEEEDESQKERVKIALLKCYGGSGAPGGSLILVKTAVTVVRPKAVISVGACSGLNPEKTKLGDAIVSSRLSTYASKVVMSDQEQSTGLRTYVSKHFLNVIKNCADGWQAPLKNPEASQAVEVHCGEILSGPEQIQAECRRDQLAKCNLMAMAVEMEGEGVFTAAFDSGIEWLIVKGIADYADSCSTQQNAKSWRRFAGVMAASLVMHILSNPTVFRSWPHYKVILELKKAGLDSPGALGREMIEKIVIATVEFEASHKECMRALPYLYGDEVVVRLFVFSGIGIPTELKSSAQEHFKEMKVKLEFLDLYNNAAYVLKDIYVEYPFDEPRRLNATDAHNITQTINSNLHLLVKHRNITAVQASYKIENSKQTERPCITIYVLGKDFIPIGESAFPPFLGHYPVDIVNGFWYRTMEIWTPTETQKPCNELCFGTSIAVKGKKESGTLGAIVKDSSSGTFYALSCNHVMETPEKTEIIHPGQNDYLNYLNYHLKEYSLWINHTISFDQPRILFKFLNDTAELSERFDMLNQMRDNHSDPDRETRANVQWADFHKQCLKEGLAQPPRVIGKYVAGVSKNETWNGVEYFIDAAVAQLTEKEVELLKSGKVPQIIRTGLKPNGECSPVPKPATESVGDLCKSGRTTDFTDPGVLCNLTVLQDTFHKADGHLINAFRRVSFCQNCAKRCGLKPTPKSAARPSCDSCREDTAVLLKDLWYKNCLGIKHKEQKSFSEEGDSGAVVFERASEEERNEAAKEVKKAAEEKEKAAEEREKATAEKEKAAKEREKAAEEKEKAAEEREKAAAEKEKAAEEREKAAVEKEKAAEEREKAAKEKQEFVENLFGFGIIFAEMKHVGIDRRASLASPLQVALDALSKAISINSQLKLVSDYRR